MLGSSRLLDILSQTRGKRVAVMGDYMLDRHMVGAVKRISPEAPVPVVEIEDERSSLGGAGNVVANLASLGAKPVVFGVCGSDGAKALMTSHLDACKSDCLGLLERNDRRTTEKIRVIAHDQHVVRVDRETVKPLSADETALMLNAFDSALPTLDAIILQDYNKGVLTAEVIQYVLEKSKVRGIPVAVDPKFDNFTLYCGAHLFKPNLREAERALGVRITDESSLDAAISKLLDALSPDVLMLTRGDKGMTICANGKRTTIPTQAQDVADVSGAGDTVISTFVACELGGASVTEAATLANIAAGIVCEQVGVVPIDIERLQAACERSN